MDKQFTNIEVYHDGISQHLMIHRIEAMKSEAYTPEMKDFTAVNYDAIKERYPEAYKWLLDFFPKNCKNHKYEVVRMFMRCNFFNNDSQPDIDQHGNYHLENVPCPMRGQCAMENKVCRPKLNTKLTQRELEVARAMVLTKNSKEQVADLLFISVFTVENHRRNIYAKLSIHNYGQLVEYLTVNNLIKL